TQEQFEALDAMAANPRVLFEGPAGTGKTLLAIEAARRSAAEGRRVLFVCFNRLLAKKLLAECSSLELVKTRTLHRQMLDVIDREAPVAETSDSFWANELPEQAVAHLLASTDTKAFDEIIIDEAQDILRDQYLDFLDLSVSGGLAAGRWRFFG